MKNLQAKQPKKPIQTLGQKAALAFFNSAKIGAAPIARDEIPALAKIIDREIKKSGIVDAADNLYDVAMNNGANHDDAPMAEVRKSLSAITGVSSD